MRVNFMRTFVTVWPSGLRRWLQAPVRKGVGSNPTAVNEFMCACHYGSGPREGILYDDVLWAPTFRYHDRCTIGWLVSSHMCGAHGASGSCPPPDVMTRDAQTGRLGSRCLRQFGRTESHNAHRAVYVGSLITRHARTHGCPAGMRRWWWKLHVQLGKPRPRQKACEGRNSPTCTLSQNGYGDGRCVPNTICR